MEIIYQVKNKIKYLFKEIAAGAETRSDILLKHQRHARSHVQEILGNIVVAIKVDTFTAFIQNFKFMSIKSIKLEKKQLLLSLKKVRCFIH